MEPEAEAEAEVEAEAEAVKLAFFRAIGSGNGSNLDCRKTFWNSITVCSESMGFLQLFDFPRG